MRLLVVAVGRLRSGPERDLVDRYRERAVAMSRAQGFAGPDVVEVAEGRGRRPEERRTEEMSALRERVAATSVALLDERGASLTSAKLAARLAALRDEGRAGLSFVIGGPDGTSPELRDAAELSLSFGRLTIPHGLVRVLVFEQIYRVLTILAGHPYHRDGDGRGAASARVAR